MNHFVTVDSTLCTGCHTCEAVCSEMHRQHGLQSIPCLRAMLNEKESAPQFCHHCEDASCVMVCPVNAITRAGGAVQSNESLCVSCKLCGIACPFDAIESPSGRSLDIPTNANTPKASLASPAPTRVSTSLDWVPGTRVIAVKCDLCSFDEQGPACARMYSTKTLHLVDNTGIARVGGRKRELTFNMDFGDLTLFQQAQSGEAE